MQRRIARAIIIEGERVLLVRAVSKINYFLPGGGIEPGETPQQAISRELKEELKREITIDQLMYVHHNSYNNGAQLINEKIFLFTARINNAQRNSIVSAERHIEFSWINLADLTTIPLLPAIHGRLVLKSSGSKNPIFYS